MRLDIDLVSNDDVLAAANHLIQSFMCSRNGKCTEEDQQLSRLVQEHILRIRETYYKS